jgi:uncharacterized protein
MRHLTAIALVLFSTISTAGYGADFENGLAAANKGDYATALREWLPLAEQGDADAQFNLGQMYQMGWGVDKNYITAFDWYKKASAQGNPRAQYNLAHMYQNGWGVERDSQAAFKWYTVSAEQGDPFAQLNLGQIYRQRMKNYESAVKWYTLSAEQGVALAQYNLALLYGKGLGVKKDYATAHMWATISNQHGHREALGILEILDDNMTISQIRNAKKLLDECTRKNYINC